MRTVAFCECEPFCRAVLAARWPGVPCHADVATLDGEWLRANGLGRLDIVCAGFPCQDISYAGAGAGISGARSGLFFHVTRLAAEIRPRWLLFENVAALRARGLDSVLRALAALGYDGQWHCLPASALGAPHRRDRIWIVARACGQGQLQPDRPFGEVGQRAGGDGCQGGATANTDGARLAFWQSFGSHLRAELAAAQRAHTAFGWWAVEPDVGRVAYGVPARMDRLRALGSAVVPQIPEIIGRTILRAEHLSID